EVGSASAVILSHHVATAAIVVRSKDQRRRIPNAITRLGSPNGSTNPTAASVPNAAVTKPAVRRNHKPNSAAGTPVARINPGNGTSRTNGVPARARDQGAGLKAVAGRNRQRDAERNRHHTLIALNGSSATARARLMAVVSCRWCLAQLPVIRLGTSLPRSVTKLDSARVSLKSM